MYIEYASLTLYPTVTHFVILVCNSNAVIGPLIINSWIVSFLPSSQSFNDTTQILRFILDTVGRNNLEPTLDCLSLPNPKNRLIIIRWSWYQKRARIKWLSNIFFCRLFSSTLLFAYLVNPLIFMMLVAFRSSIPFQNIVDYLDVLISLTLEQRELLVQN